jgi:APA family basic amino acid/polyamine antiporter
MSHESKDDGVRSTKELKRVLGKKELYGVAFGHIIGSGVFALVGVGIGMTGKSVSLAMMLSVVIVLMQALPLILLSGTVRLRGGFYTIVGTMMGTKYAGFYVIVHFFANISLAMYALSFTDYLDGVFPKVGELFGTIDAGPLTMGPLQIVAFLVLVVFYVTNLLGIEGAAKLEIAMVLIMAVALTLFIVFGLPKVDFGSYFDADFLTAGPVGLMAAAVLLTWATAGGSDMIQLSAEAKNPTRDIPQVIVVATLAVAGFYALISIVASGVLPISEVVDQSLVNVAREILPSGLFYFFVIGGALLALSTTLNASFAWVTKPILQACVDGWLPRSWGRLSRFKTPYIILTIFFLIGLLPIFLGFDISLIATMTVLLNNILFIFICYSAAFMPKRIPDLWAKSRFHVSPAKLQVAALIGAFSAVITVGLLVWDFINSSGPLDLGLFGWEWHPESAAVFIGGTVVITVLAIAYAFFRGRTGKVDMEVSYEEA